MSESDREPSDAPPPTPLTPKKAKDPGKGDIVALGIGCLVFVIFFVAIVVVAAMRG
jgi:hypothetical protein